MHITAKFVIALLLFSAAAAPATITAAADSAIASSVDVTGLSKKKRTSLDLYVTAREAASLLRSHEGVILIDVRTPEENMFVGYPQGAMTNIPFKLVDPEYSFDANKGSYKLIPNRNFVASIRDYLEAPAAESAQTLLLMCRSGNRSAQAVNVLAEEGGFSNVYSVVDGFEGDKDDQDQRTVNGWKNAGAPWTTKVRAGYLFRSR